LHIFHPVRLHWFNHSRHRLMVNGRNNNHKICGYSTFSLLLFISLEYSSFYRFEFTPSPRVLFVLRCARRIQDTRYKINVESLRLYIRNLTIALVFSKRRQHFGSGCYFFLQVKEIWRLSFCVGPQGTDNVQGMTVIHVLAREGRSIPAWRPFPKRWDFFVRTKTVDKIQTNIIRYYTVK
jgi:hypothetical protein